MRLLKSKKKTPPAEEDPKLAEDDPERHYAEPLDYFEEERGEDTLRCPECAKERKHVLLVKTGGEQLECPECHYIRELKRI